jgi:hypothetical protein
MHDLAVNLWDGVKGAVLAFVILFTWGLLREWWNSL